jgi:hypothetical protein
MRRRPPPAERLQIGLGMALPEIDRQIGDTAGVRAVLTERAGAEGAADAVERLRRHLLDPGADGAGAHLAALLGIQRVGVDGGGGIRQQQPAARERDLDPAEVGEGVAGEGARGGRGPQRRGDADGAAVPDRGDADAAVPEARPAQVSILVADQRIVGDCCCDGDRRTVAAGHADGLPGARLDRPVVAWQQEQESLAPGAGGDQRVRELVGARGIRLRAVETPAARHAAGVHGAPAGLRRPDAEARVARRRGTELGQDRHRIEVTLREPRQRRTRLRNGGEDPEPLGGAPGPW